MLPLQPSPPLHVYGDKRGHPYYDGEHTNNNARDCAAHNAAGTLWLGN